MRFSLLKKVIGKLAQAISVVTAVAILLPSIIIVFSPLMSPNGAFGIPTHLEQYFWLLLFGSPVLGVLLLLCLHHSQVAEVVTRHPDIDVLSEPIGVFGILQPVLFIVLFFVAGGSR